MRRWKDVGGVIIRPNRDIHKSLRMDSRAYNYIMQHEGNGFSDKLENLIIEHARLTGREEDYKRGTYKM